MNRIAISHDWLAAPRGAERVLGEFCRGFPEISIYTLFCDRRLVPESVSQHSVHVSWLDRIPGIARHYRFLLPWFHEAMDGFQLEDADLLLSISHSVAKAIPHPDRIPHVCYCLTPARYLWEPQLYGPTLHGTWRRSFLDWVCGDFKLRDLQANQRVDHFVAISRTIQQRIHSRYQRESQVIYPCIDLDFYWSTEQPREDFYLIVSALVPQKRIELAIQAFNQNGRPLRIAGSGPMRGKLGKLAGENISFLGWQSDEAIRELYRTARALIFPGFEDFGMVPVEAQACGCPVIAYRGGGVTETVLEGETGIFFSQATPDSLATAIREFESCRFDPARAVGNVQRFSRQAFWREWKCFLQTIGLDIPGPGWSMEVLPKSGE